MTLFLDHQQRLNLIALLGLLECNVGETRAVWKLQDHLALNEAEQRDVGYFVETQNGNEFQGWDRTKSLPPRSYDLADGDLRRIQLAIRQFPRHRAGIARCWLEPLLEQMPELVEETREVRNA